MLGTPPSTHVFSAAGNFFTVALGTIIAYAWNEIAKDDICSKVRRLST